jgi:hypothetical protein
MSPAERRTEIAAILAAGFLRLKRRGRTHSAAKEPSPELSDSPCFTGALGGRSGSGAPRHSGSPLNGVLPKRLLLVPGAEGATFDSLGQRPRKRSKKGNPP